MSVLNIIELSVILNTTLMKTTLNSTLDTLVTTHLQHHAIQINTSTQFMKVHKDYKCENNLKQAF